MPKPTREDILGNQTAIRGLGSMVDTPDYGPAFRISVGLIAPVRKLIENPELTPDEALRRIYDEVVKEIAKRGMKL